jgi:hypothetical protein
VVMDRGRHEGWRHRQPHRPGVTVGVGVR